jgi:hypothetical protein
MPVPYSDNLYSADNYLDDDEEEIHDYIQNTDFDYGIPGILSRPSQSFAQPVVSFGELENNFVDNSLSPTDGYFRSSPPSSSTPFSPSQSNWPNQDHQYYYPAHTEDLTYTSPPISPAYRSSTSANVPHVPNVLVEDPSLSPQDSKAADKAREAREESLNNQRAYSSPSPSSAFAHQAPQDRLEATSAFSQTGGHSRTESSTSASHYTPSSAYAFTPSVDSYSSPGPEQTRYTRRPTYADRSQYYPIPSEAPPAYTPSPTSPTTSSAADISHRNYQTFPGATHGTVGNSGQLPAAIMGNPEESSRLLGQPWEPEHMGDAPYHYEPYDAPPSVSSWSERLLSRFSFLSKKSARTVLGGLVLLGVFLFFVISLFTASGVSSIFFFLSL